MIDHDMIGPIVGVEPPFTVHAIIRTVDKGRKGRAAMKMMIGFQQTNLMGAAGPLKIRKNGFIRVITKSWY